MNRRHWLSLPLLVCGLAAPVMINCGALGGVLGDVTGAPKCPEGMDNIASFDWAGQFKIDADAAGKIKGGLLAAGELKSFADDIEKDIKGACAGIAADLGAGSEFASAEDACKAAAKAITDTKGKLGAKATIALDFKLPECNASIKAMADCGGRCDVSVKPGEVQLKCEGGEISGKCGGECKGSCNADVAAACDGTCSGSCEVDIKGKCAGTCHGKCDGKDSSGTCKGKCEGTCGAQVEKAQCKGKCGGKCDVKGSAKCEGTCSGACSVAFEAPRCSGKITPPEMKADCKASCEASAELRAECTDPKISYRIVGATDTEAAKKLQATIEKHIPVIIKLAVGLKDRVIGAVKNVKSVIEGGISAGESIGGSMGGDLQAKARGAALIACMTPLKGAIDAAAKLEVSVNVSVQVQGSVSAGTK